MSTGCNTKRVGHSQARIQLLELSAVQVADQGRPLPATSQGHGSGALTGAKSNKDGCRARKARRLGQGSASERREGPLFSEAQRVCYIQVLLLPLPQLQGAVLRRPKRL